MSWWKFRGILQRSLIVNEAGGHAKPTYGLGLYLWFTAFLLTTIAEFLKQRIYQNLKENTKE